jgi:hypothetical protein
VNSLTEYLKSQARKWVDRDLPPAKPALGHMPVPAPAAHDAIEDGTGIWLAACLVGPGDQVRLADRWLTVESVAKSTPSLERSYPGYTALTMLDGSTLAGGFAAKVYMRDEASEIAAEIRKVIAQ